MVVLLLLFQEIITLILKILLLNYLHVLQAFLFSPYFLLSLLLRFFFLIKSPSRVFFPITQPFAFHRNSIN